MLIPSNRKDDTERRHLLYRNSNRIKNAAVECPVTVKHLLVDAIHNVLPSLSHLARAN